MLSYQHLYHAGNLADVHKHSALAWVVEYMTRKAKPMVYLETHGGRGVYDLTAEEAIKTGEAEAGIGRVLERFPDVHPYVAAIRACRAEFGPMFYPGSPWIASHGLRGDDVLHVAELHPQEHKALQAAVPGVHVHQQDGFAMAHAMCPPTPRRGLMLIDPSYEVKDDYTAIPKHLAKIVRAWPVGVIMLWYPILSDARHSPMVRVLRQGQSDALYHEVRFPPARDGHRMIGSGLVVVNPPWGLAEHLRETEGLFASL